MLREIPNVRPSAFKEWAAILVPGIIACILLPLTWLVVLPLLVIERLFGISILGDKCPECRGKILVTSSGHWDGSQGGGFFGEGQCSKCGVKLILPTQKGASWQPKEILLKGPGNGHPIDKNKLTFDGPFHKIDYKDSFSEKEFENIKIGFTPQSQDDHWLIYFDAPTIFIHRSWTGKCTYKVTLEREREVYCVKEALAWNDGDTASKEFLSPDCLRKVLRLNLRLNT